MILADVPRVAVITQVLADAGLDEEKVHEWLHTRRRELLELTPALALLTIIGPNVAGRVEALARADAQELRARGVLVLGPYDLPAGWEGTD